MTSRPVVGFSQNLFQKMRDTLPEKVTENYHAISGSRAAGENFVQGVVNLTPPPVDLGLKGMFSSGGEGAQGRKLF